MSVIYTVRSVAEMYGISEVRVRQIAINRKLGRMVGNVRIFTRKEVENMAIRERGKHRNKNHAK